MFLSSMVSKSVAGGALSSPAVRLLLGYLLFGVFAAWRAEAAPLANNSLAPAELCTADGLTEYLQSMETANEDELALVYEHCRAEFLERNTISRVVKESVDEWVGTDLSTAETDLIFLAYELTLIGPKPGSVPDSFEGECTRMVDQFDAFRESLTPITSQLELDLDTLLSEEGPEEVEDEARDLLNYVQYSLFCKALLVSARPHHHATESDIDFELDELGYAAQE